MSKDPIEQYFMDAVRVQALIHTGQDYGSNVGGAAGRTGTKRLSLSSLARSLGLSGRQFLASIYENMMGFPPGWLSSVALLTEMPSPPSSPNSSGERS